MKKFAWIPVVVTGILMVVSIAIAGLGSFDELAGPWSIGTVTAAVAGALIITRRPSHPIGWMFTAFGLLTSSGFVPLCLGLAVRIANRDRLARRNRQCGATIGRDPLTGRPPAVSRRSSPLQPMDGGSRR